MRVDSVALGRESRARREGRHPASATTERLAEGSDVRSGPFEGPLQRGYELAV